MTVLYCDFFFKSALLSYLPITETKTKKKKKSSLKRMCSRCIWIFVLSLLCGWGQMNQGIYWGHQAFCAWVSAVVHQFHSYWQRAAITAHINKVTCQKVWTLAILSTLTNDQRCCVLARTVFALKGTCTVPSLLFFILFFSLSVFIHCLWRKKKIIQLSWCGEISLLRSTASVCAGLSCTSNKILCRLQT